MIFKVTVSLLYTEMKSVFLSISKILWTPSFLSVQTYQLLTVSLIIDRGVEA